MFSSSWKWRTAVSQNLAAWKRATAWLSNANIETYSPYESTNSSRGRNSSKPPPTWAAIATVSPFMAKINSSYQNENITPSSERCAPDRDGSCIWDILIFYIILMKVIKGTGWCEPNRWKIHSFDSWDDVTENHGSSFSFIPQKIIYVVTNCKGNRCASTSQKKSFDSTPKPMWVSFF